MLRPGGRIGVSDVVAEDQLTAEERAQRGSYVGCIAGALSKSEYQAGLVAAGFTDVAVDFTHEVADGMYAAIVKAVSPLHDSHSTAVAAEAIGTFALVFAGCGAIMVDAKTGELGQVGIAIASGS